MPAKPIEITDSIIKEAEELAGQGLTSAEIAQSLEMSRATLYNKIKNDPRLMDSIKRGRFKTYKKVTGKLMALIDQGDRAAIFFYLKTRHGWKESTGDSVSEALSEKAQTNLNKLRAANDSSDD